MTDITTPLTELRAAYRAYQNAKRDKKEEITEKYRSRMEDEIRAAVQAEKYAFASLLKDRKEFYDLRVTDIQDHVLRTRNWKVWEDIRDFADIEPEQVIRSNAREAKALAAKPYHWSDDFSTLTLTRTSTGVELENPVIFPASTVRIRNGQYSAVSENERYELAAVKAENNAKDYFRMLDTAIREQIEAGNIDNPEEGD